MSRFIPLSRIEGIASRQAHCDLPEGTYEREISKEGFYGPASFLHHRHPPCRGGTQAGRETAVEGGEQGGARSVIDLPQGGQHRSAAGGHETGGEAEGALTIDREAVDAPAGGKHDDRRTEHAVVEEVGEGHWPWVRLGTRQQELGAQHPIGVDHCMTREVKQPSVA